MLLKVINKMSLDCEICGSAPASVKVSIDGVILQVCSSCSSAGKIIEQPRQIKQPVFTYSPPDSAETVAEDFGKIISKARQQLGLKQEELANRLNEKLPAIQAAENGKRLDLALAKKFEKFLKITLIERN